MNSSGNNTWVLLGAAVVGLVSAAGVYLIEQLRKEKRQHVLSEDVARLNLQLSTLREELETLRRLQKERFNNSTTSNTKRRKRNLTAVSATTDDYSSAVDYDSSDLEFYDLSSDENDVSGDKDALDIELKEIDKELEDDTRYEFLLLKLETLNIKCPKNAEILWRLGKVLKTKINSTHDPKEKRELIDRGISLLETATVIKPNSAQCHKWLAILIGLRGDLQPTKERILDGHLFREHIVKALEITPDDPTLQHLLGRFTFEIAKLNWLEKTLAATLFAELPQCTYEDALRYFLIAEKMNANDWKENRLFIAKCELGLGKIDEAMEWLNKAESATNYEDESVHEEVKTLLQKHNK